MAVDRTKDIEEVNADLKILADALNDIKNVCTINSDVTETLATLKDYYISSVNIPQEDFGSRMTSLNEDAAGAINSLISKILEAHQKAIRLLNDYLKEQEEYEKEQLELEQGA